MELGPAAGLAFAVTAALCGLQLLPVGKGAFLVRTHGDAPGAAMFAAAMAGAAFMSIPSPGFAVIYGEASRIRSSLGLAVPWKGIARCSIKP